MKELMNEKCHTTMRIWYNIDVVLFHAKAIII